MRQVKPIIIRTPEQVRAVHHVRYGTTTEPDYETNNPLGHMRQTQSCAEEGVVWPCDVEVLRREMDDRNARLGNALNSVDGRSQHITAIVQKAMR